MTSGINGMMVGSNKKYIVLGKNRGLISEHRTYKMAVKSQDKDYKGCEKRGEHSDARVYEARNGLWYMMITR